MKYHAILLTLCTSFSTSGFAADWLHVPAKDGTANGKKIVLVAGDEEYRSEETCPMLAKILMIGTLRVGYEQHLVGDRTLVAKAKQHPSFSVQHA